MRTQSGASNELFPPGTGPGTETGHGGRYAARTRNEASVASLRPLNSSGSTEAQQQQSPPTTYEATNLVMVANHQELIPGVESVSVFITLMESTLLLIQTQAAHESLLCIQV